MSYSKHDDSNVEKIDYVEFGILSPEQILEQSVVEVVNHNTYCGNTPVANGLFDPKMGTLELGNICPTDLLSSKLTPGYFGHINLSIPVFHFHFFHQVQKIFKCICYRCGSQLSDKNHSKIDKKMKLGYQIENSKKIKICPNCAAKVPTKIVKTDLCKFHLLWSMTDSNSNDEKLDISAKYALNLFRIISDETVLALGFDPKIAHPKNMIMTVYPVCPPACRPSINQDSGARLEDDVTIKYCDILKFNNMIHDKLISDPNARILEDWSNILQYHCATLMDNEITGIMQSAQRSGRPLKGIRQRLKGKEGRIRGNLMGKRVNFSARSVITPDPIIDLDELGVPKKIALKMTFPEKVKKKNIKRLKNAVRNGCTKYPGARSVWKHTNNKTISLNHIDVIAFADMIELGDVVIRHIINGDIVLFNRQPSLHKMSMMAHRVRVLDGLTFRLNVSATTPYNADFDGDEMNMHVPQTIATANEITQLASVKTQIISPATNFPIISFVQDTVLGGYLISINGSKKFSGCEFMNICNDSDLSVLERFGAKKTYNGFDLLSTCLPIDLNIQLKNNSGALVSIISGIIQNQSGYLDKKVFTNLIHYIFNEYGYDTCSEFFNKTQKVVRSFLLRDSFSVGIRDIMNTIDTDIQITDKIKQQNLEVEKKIHQIHSNMFSATIDTRRVSFETKVMQNLNKARSSAEILLKGIHDSHNTNRFMNMVNSGAKGKLINLAQMTACLGQQIIEGKRVPNGIKDRTLPHFHKFDESGIARGFVESSFKTGLNPLEFFFHAMAGREGIIDTACKTASTGYIQRKLMKSLEDFKICESNTVSDSQNNIVQYLFGDDFIDATTLEYVSVPIVDVFDFKKEYEIRSADSKTKTLLKNFVIEITEMYDWYKHIYNGNPESKMKFPINFNRILYSISNSYDGKNEDDDDLTVKYILDTYDILIHDLKIHKYNHGTWMLKFLLYQTAHPKRILNELNKSKKHFDTFISIVKSKFRNSHIQSGEAVGAVAAQSIGEPCTQLTLNTFHLSGVGAKSTVTRGVPRMQEIFHLTKNPKNPSMTLKLHPEFSKHISSVQKVSNEITLISAGELLNSSEIIFETENSFKEVESYILDFNAKFDIYEKDTSKWVLTFRFDDKKLHEKGIEIDDIYHAIITHFSNELIVTYIDDNYSENLIRIKIEKYRSRNSDLNKYITATCIPEVGILSAIERQVMNDVIIRGANNIEKSHIRRDNLSKSFVIDTLGSNLLDVVKHSMVDENNCVSNDFHEMNQIYGIEVARNCIITELIEVLEEAADIDIRHIQLLADSMTSGGVLCPIDRNGMRQNNSSVLQKISFEESVQQLFKASMHGDKDNLENCSASIMFGQNPKIGTGSVDVVFDQERHSELVNNNTKNENDYEPEYEQDYEFVFGV